MLGDRGCESGETFCAEFERLFVFRVAAPLPAWYVHCDSRPRLVQFSHGTLESHLIFEALQELQAL